MEMEWKQKIEIESIFYVIEVFFCSFSCLAVNRIFCTW